MLNHYKSNNNIVIISKNIRKIYAYRLHNDFFLQCVLKKTGFLSFHGARYAHVKINLAKVPKT